MNYLQQVQQGIDYIEANLDYEISVDRVAAASGISRWHFQRIFKALTQETLKTYIRSRRLANSLDKLLSTDTKIIDIAIAAGYESQESFSRTFKKTFDLTPGAFRKLGDKSLFLQNVKIDSEYLHHVAQNISLAPDIYQQKTLNLVGLKTNFYSVDSEKNNIGEKLPPLWEAFLNRMEEIDQQVDGTVYGVVHQSGVDSEQLEYYAAVEVTAPRQIPTGMTRVTVPAALYAKFEHKGEARTIDNTVNYIYSNWLMTSERRHTYAQDIEFYGNEYHPTAADSIMHYAIPIR